MLDERSRLLNKNDVPKLLSQSTKMSSETSQLKNGSFEKVDYTYFLKVLRKWCQLLEVHNGRDKVIRLTGFTCTIISDFPGVRQRPIAKRISHVGRQLSYCRTILRLFDDLPMLNRTLSYGLGSHEKDKIMQISNLLSNMINTCYYPMEHLAWAGDQGVLPIDSKPFWKGVSYCWTSTMYLAIVRTVRTISCLIQKRAHSLKTGKTDEESSQFHRNMFKEVLTLAQQMSDFGIAVNGIPGFLWGGKLKPRHIGLLGIISTFITICKLLGLMP